MKQQIKKHLKPALLSAAVALALSVQTVAIADGHNEQDSLKMAAVEALMVAPPERALPVLRKLLASNNSDELKGRALFILGQIDLPEAREALLEVAGGTDTRLQHEAIRAIGISGDHELTAQLSGIYAAGNMQVKEAVLQSYMIAGDVDSVFAIASNTDSDEEFEAAVQMLGIMGATEQLKQLRDYPGATETLVHAYAIAGDTESLTLMARDSSNPERQLAAIQGLGISGGDEVSGVFYDIYQGTDNYEIKEAVMHGMLVAGDDESVLKLFKAADNDREKADLLRLLVTMDSDAAMDAIDEALGGDL